MNADDAPIAQRASHAYLRVGADLAEAGLTDLAVIAVRAAEAEVYDPEPVNPPWCDCTRCALYLSGAWRLIR
jgi:hypothetical protein